MLYLVLIFARSCWVVLLSPTKRDLLDLKTKGEQDLGIRTEICDFALEVYALALEISALVWLVECLS